MSQPKITSAALRYWMKKKNITQTKLAEITGLSQNYISQINTGARPGSLETIQLISNALDLDLPDFLACKDENLPEFVFVEKVLAKPQETSDSLVTDGDHAGYYAFHNSFIARKGGTPNDMKIFEIAGNSMSPTLKDRDFILVNLKDTNIRTGYIYLIRMDDELMVKRLENRPGGILILRSDNPDYDDIKIDKNNEDIGVQVYGRMVWSCREY